MGASACPFLDLPTELRLQIYSDALFTSPAITISSAKVTGAPSDVVYRLHADERAPFPGLPLNHEPVIEDQYDPSLLSATTPAIIPITSEPSDPPYRDNPHPACVPLLLVNKQITNELKSHFNLHDRRNASLFISYPNGLHVLRTMAPSLIGQARSIHLAGIYHPTTYSPTHRAFLASQAPQPIPPAHNYNGRIMPDSPTQLADTIKALFGPSARHAVDKLELRIYYPGDDSYSTVWGDDCSPVVLALRNIYTGDIGITVYRGRYGTGVHLSARANEERRRVVSTVWRRLEEGRRGEPACGSWVVDDRWPEWQGGDEEREGDAMVTSAPRDES